MHSAGLNLSGCHTIQDNLGVVLVPTEVPKQISPSIIENLLKPPVFEAMLKKNTFQVDIL